jgi:hypothetical protein
MRQGKKICETLKGIRRDIAEANEIDYQPTECTHEGDCAGTCPKCESETRWLEKQLRIRRALGKAVIVAGLTFALSAAPVEAKTHHKSKQKTHKTYHKKHKKGGGKNQHKTAPKPPQQPPKNTGGVPPKKDGFTKGGGGGTKAPDKNKVPDKM